MRMKRKEWRIYRWYDGSLLISHESTTNCPSRWVVEYEPPKKLESNGFLKNIISLENIISHLLLIAGGVGDRLPAARARGSRHGSEVR